MLRVLLFLTFLGLLFRCPIYTAVCLLLAAGLALRTAPWLAARAEGFDVLVRRSLVALTVLLAATILVFYGRQIWAEHRALGHHPSGAARAVQHAILIVLDTVRAESLQPLRLSARHHPQSDAAGRAWAVLRPRLRNGSLDGPVAREHVHGPMAP